MGRKLASVRAFFRWLVHEGGRKDDPTAGLPMPKLEKRLPRPLSIDDCEQLITKDERVVNQPAPEGGDRARRVAWMTLRDRALVELLYGTGIRVGELVSLDVRDLELRSQEILLKQLGPMIASCIWILDCGASEDISGGGLEKVTVEEVMEREALAPADRARIITPADAARLGLPREPCEEIEVFLAMRSLGEMREDEMLQEGQGEEEGAHQGESSEHGLR